MMSSPAPTNKPSFHTTRKKGIRPPPVSTGCFKPSTNAILVPILQHSAPWSHLVPVFNTTRYKTIEYWLVLWLGAKWLSGASHLVPGGVMAQY